MNYWLEVIRFTPIAEQVIEYFKGEVIDYEFTTLDQWRPLITFRIKNGRYVSFGPGVNIDMIIDYINRKMKEQKFCRI